jgi:cytochrome c oxidase subunit 2
MMLMALLAPAAAFAEYKLNLQTPNTALGHTIYDLHMVITWICVVIFVVVFGFMFYAVYAHRKSVGHKAANFHEHFWVEVGWTVVPAIILVAMAWPATRALIQLRDTSDPDLTIKVTGYQWKWGYDYIKGEGEGISFFSSLSTPQAQITGSEPKGPNYLLETDTNVVVPVGKKVRVLLTAADVIHAWWVPALTIKQDAIPGFIRDTWFKAEKPGIYRGQCAELCGKDHGFMPIVVEVKSAADYTAWVNEQKTKMNAGKAAAAAALTKTWKAKGEKVYAANCVACHQANGKGTPPAFPAIDGSKIATGPKDAHLAIVLNGKPNTAMAAFKHLSDEDIAAVVTYERNNWGNKAGGMVTPAEVNAAKGGAPAPAAAASPAPTAAAEPAKSEAAPAAAAALPAVVFFDSGKAAASAESKKALEEVIAHLKANSSAKVEVTGFTDKTGNLNQNMELAKQRAVGVRDALMAGGVSKDRINLKPPATVEAGGDAKQARRVDIKAAG